MKLFGRAVLLSILLGSSGCVTAPVDAHQHYEMSPIEFLEYLKSYDNRLHTYIVAEQSKNWVREQDIPGLLLLLDSNQPCAGVMHEPSGSVPGRSTVGDQAAYLIEGFKSRLYPPSLYSKPYTATQKADLRRWWTNYERAHRSSR